MRRATIGFALGLVLACDLSEALEGTPCASEKDCWHTQRCARTPAEVELNLPGLCLADDEPCAFGQQLGCGCDPADSLAACGSPELTFGEGYPAMACDPMQLVCVVQTEAHDSEESETEG